jgi:hypothetical protein
VAWDRVRAANSAAAVVPISTIPWKLTLCEQERANEESGQVVRLEESPDRLERHPCHGQHGDHGERERAYRACAAREPYLSAHDGEEYPCL